MAERSKATDCKSVGESLRWFEPNSNHHFLSPNALTASHRGAVLAQQVEHIHGKDEVGGSSPLDGSIKPAIIYKGFLQFGQKAFLF